MEFEALNFIAYELSNDGKVLSGSGCQYILEAIRLEYQIYRLKEISAKETLKATCLIPPSLRIR